MHWEFSDERNAITTANANIILDMVIALAEIFNDNTYYESGVVYINQVTVTNNVVIYIAIVSFHTGPNLDFCHVNPAGSMLAVSEMFGVQYCIAPADQKMETLHNQTEILLGSNQGDSSTMVFVETLSSSPRI
ncbi:hypothetical protein SELMODRAFT_425856 [Selaginella moellendorffii]|uniref:Uncharacterized protein n=1 Tax=Selaginella moellendorffii TaxID=88036 RepID=D8SUI5_SELML|nr:hypothetical protein SELMODRAFT_425856 [Selaginella moellendorffii]